MSSSDHWYKHDFRAWLGDLALRRCSLAAQGLLERLICLSCTGEPRGTVTVSGVAMDAEWIAEECGKPLHEVEDALADLFKHTRLQRDEHGAIIIPRMKADFERLDAARCSGAMGGNPALTHPAPARRGKRLARRAVKPSTPRPKFVPPTPAEVEAYGREIDFAIDGEAFCAFYESKGWKVGNTPMKKWQGAVVTWKKRHADDGGADVRSTLR